VSGIQCIFIVEACDAFALFKSWAKVGEIPCRIEGFPPEVVEMIRVRATEESFESKCLRGGTILQGRIEEIAEFREVRLGRAISLVVFGV